MFVAWNFKFTLSLIFYADMATHSICQSQYIFVQIIINMSYGYSLSYHNLLNPKLHHHHYLL